MTFTLVPNSGQSLGQTRDAIRTNFSVLQTTIDQNHVDLNLANKGKHYVIQMPVTASIPVAPLPPGGLVANEANIYAKTSSAASQIFFSPDASGNEYQITRAITASFALFAANAAYGAPPAGTLISGGWTFLPGGLLFQYGKFTGLGASNTPANGTIPFPVAFTGVPFLIEMTVVKDGGNGIANVSRSTPPTNTGFTYALDGSNYAGVYWTAIGI
jgi:hypothetical protein